MNALLAVKMKLILNNIYKSYGSKQVLADVNACFDTGVNAVLGPNGSGKSTLINIICGNAKADSGDVFLDSLNVSKHANVLRSQLGYVPQTLAMYPNFSEDEYLQYMSILKGIPNTEQSNEVMRALLSVGLEKEHNHLIKSLSEGMKRRLLIAQSLLGDPKVLIMDEPTAGLDPGQRIKFKKMILELSKDKIIIFATHIVSDVENISSKVFFIKNGQLNLEIKMNEIEGQDSFMTPLEERYYSVFGKNE